MEQLTLYHYLIFSFLATLAWTGFVTFIWSWFAVGGNKRSPQDHEEDWR